MFIKCIVCCRKYSLERWGKVVLSWSLSAILYNFSCLLSRDRHMMTSAHLCLAVAVLTHLLTLCCAAWLCVATHCLLTEPFGQSLEQASPKRRRLFLLKRSVPGFGE